MKSSKYTAIILTGGQSLRIQKTLKKFNLIEKGKSFLPFGDTNMINFILSKLFKIFENIMIVTSKEKYGYFKNIEFNNKEILVVKDLKKDKKSLGGIYTGLVKSKTFLNFIISCDMPFINEKIIKYLMNISKYKKYDAYVFKIDKTIQPLCAIYTKDCIKIIEYNFKKNNLKIIDVLKKVKTLFLYESLLKKYDENFISFINVNTDRDYKYALKIYKNQEV